MKILIICSRVFYKYIAPIKEKLEETGHIIDILWAWCRKEKLGARNKGILYDEISGFSLIVINRDLSLIK